MGGERHPKERYEISQDTIMPVLATLAATGDSEVPLGMLLPSQLYQQVQADTQKRNWSADRPA